MITAAACLAMAIYHEGRSEPVDAQMAIAEVVINLINGLGHLFEDGIGNGEDFAYGHGP